MQTVRGFSKQSHEVISIFFRDDENSAVKNALSHLKEDLECILDCDVEHSITQEGADIVVWTAGTDSNSDLNSTYDMVEALLDSNGNLYTEAFHISVRKGQMLICGADRRGTVYGIYELSRRIGVSPWYYWGDVPRRKRNNISFEEGFSFSDRPGIPYRGIFINDEEELEAWVKNGGIEKTIGPSTYERVYELLLRLKGNIMWPAMHVNAFNHDPENARLADEMGVMIGTSHCDIMMRNNYCEWEGWTSKKGYSDLLYDYSIDGINRQRLKEYWSESVNENKDYEICFTLGMRGIHDSEFETREIDRLDLSDEEKLKRKKMLLEEIIRDQQEILSEQGVDKDALQIFVPYKEVLTIYDAGLNVPENVTLMWVDDNFGYMRRYPDEKESQRKGGNGLYYHGSYWGHPNMSYLFLNSIPLAHTQHELYKSYEKGIRKIWIYNAGALKPLEQDIDFFLHTAWNIGKENYDQDTSEYLKRFFDETFTGNIGLETSEILTEWSQITNMCKLEHLRKDSFSQLGVFDMAAWRIHRLHHLMKKANRLWETIAEDEKDAFYQFVLFKLQSSYCMNGIFYFADRSRLCIEQGKFNAADAYCESVYQLSDQMTMMVDFYNTSLAGGKWNKLITPFDYPPPAIAKIYDCMPAALIGNTPDTRWSVPNKSKSKVTVIFPENDDEKEIVFWEGGISVKCIEIFPTGYKANERFKVEHSKGIKVSQSEGQVETETRVGIWITDADEFSESEYVRVYDEDDVLAGEYRISYKRHRISDSFFETDGNVIIDADKLHGSEWRIVPLMGRGRGSVLEYVGDQRQSRDPLEFSFEVSDTGEYTIEIQRFPSLNMSEDIFLSMYVDGNSVTFSSEATDEWRGNWKTNVLTEVELLTATVTLGNAALHNICIYAASSYFAFSRILIYKGDHTDLSGMAPIEQITEDYFDIPKIGLDDFTCYKEFSKVRKKTRGETKMIGVLEFSEEEIDLVKAPIAMRKITKIPRMPSQIDWNEIKNEVAGNYCPEENVIRIRALDALTESEYAWTGPDENSFKYALSGYPLDNRYYVYFDDPEQSGQTGKLSYRISVPKGRGYMISLHANIYDGTQSPVTVSVDHVTVPVDSMSGKGRLWTFAGLREFQLIDLARVYMSEGEHIITFSVKECVRIKDILVTPLEVE